jgi:hypothetical protein
MRLDILLSRCQNLIILHLGSTLDATLAVHTDYLLLGDPRFTTYLSLDWLWTI